MVVNFQDHVNTLGYARLNGTARGAVAKAVHMGPFKKLVACDHGVKVSVAAKIIFAAMLFLPTWRARGVRHRRLYFRVQLAQGVDQAGFTCPTGGGYNEKITRIIQAKSS